MNDELETALYQAENTKLSLEKRKNENKYLIYKLGRIKEPSHEENENYFLNFYQILIICEMECTDISARLKMLSEKYDYVKANKKLISDLKGLTEKINKYLKADILHPRKLLEDLKPYIDNYSLIQNLKDKSFVNEIDDLISSTLQVIEDSLGIEYDDLQTPLVRFRLIEYILKSKQEKYNYEIQKKQLDYNDKLSNLEKGGEMVFDGIVSKVALSVGVSYLKDGIDFLYSEACEIIKLYNERKSKLAQVESTAKEDTPDSSIIFVKRPEVSYVKKGLKRRLDLMILSEKEKEIKHCMELIEDHNETLRLLEKQASEEGEQPSIKQQKHAKKVWLALFGASERLRKLIQEVYGEQIEISGL